MAIAARASAPRRVLKLNGIADNGNASFQSQGYSRQCHVRNRDIGPGECGAPAHPDGRLETIQILRAFAVIFVVVSHAMHELANQLSSSVVQINEKRFPGDFGVDLFFVVSGFIMVYVSRDAFARPGAAVDFLRRRVIRIVPLYWLMTTLMIAVVILLPHRVNTATSDIGQWLASYFFIPYARSSDGLIRPVLGLGWSLQYEMLFYLLFAIGLTMPMRRALPAILALILACFAVGQMFFGQATIFRFLSHPIQFEFAAGVLIGWAYVRGLRLPRWLCAAFAVAGLVLLVVAPAFDDMVDRTRHLHYGIPALLFVAASILFPGADRYRSGGWLVAMGESSYSTYLVHPFVLGVIVWAIQRFAPADILKFAPCASLFVGTAIVCSLAAGLFVHRYVDLRLNRLARKILARRRRQPVAVAAIG